MQIKTIVTTQQQLFQEEIKAKEDIYLRFTFPQEGDLLQNRPCKKDPPKEKLAKANHKVFLEIDFSLLELVTPFRAWQQRGKSRLFTHN
jgi:hypothetical protein